jgi:hypothetical protein
MLPGSEVEPNEQTIDYQERQARKNELFFQKNLPREFLDAVEAVRPHSLLSIPAMLNAWLSVKFIVSRGLHGSIVECGIWQGGCLELMAKARDSAGGLNQIIGVDTFDGHPPQTTVKRTFGGETRERFTRAKKSRDKNGPMRTSTWCHAGSQNSKNCSSFRALLRKLLI